MKAKWKYALLGFFLAMDLLIVFVLRSVYSSQSYGQLINYVGIVRGATQRLVKLEMNNQPSDSLITYLDDIMDNLSAGEGKYGLILPDDKEYRACLGELATEWASLKEDIYNYRGGYTDAKVLLENSEIYFNQANKTVFAAEAYSKHRTTNLLRMTVVLIICIVLIWLLIFWSSLRKMLNLEHANKSLEDKAGRDILTNVYTVDKFKKTAQEFLDEDSGLKYAVFYVDFADFKYINDVFGYEWGDRILKEYGGILEQDLDEKEVVGRVNADNFVILRHYETKKDVLNRQKEVDKKITDYMRNSGNRHILSVCCGLCCLEDVIESLKIEGLMDRANFARKAVKTGKFDRYRFYNESIRRQLFLEKDIESCMGSALENKEFKVYYQPKVDLKTNQIVCSEALARWQKADGTIIPPSDFIPVFEKNYTIPLLDRYIFEEVCRWLRHLLDDGLQALPVSVNVSRLQFYNSDFVSIYTEIRDKYNIPPSLLEIEFTETILFDNWDELSKIVEDLHSAGFSSSIDDFGKGYSSLSTVQNLNVDVLKIDAAFFPNITSKEKDRLLVEGIIKLVKQFGVVTVAEGIETEEQAEVLRGIGCDMIQGYVFYRPMPEQDYESLLFEKNSGETEAAKRTAQDNAVEEGLLHEGKACGQISADQGVYYQDNGEFA
ncbi:bifunctional diguanylate cyclase/phosphodiesterase [Eubacterium sp. am_0171]|uniref:putative bifunctional diguanylate cyclase/phosphodiesterase n=1 Tax=unclassified Eubacterium (in: firmicutes) TaxID=2624479 RepID=UPI0010221BFA|nr:MULTISPECIES: bifunctional diguanylate cyclase/phosphodiesterase [unclassified Eubacterium (in: firmicutes)]MBS6762431.1 bifunctional diguanylate cyclase/phosphodiesterase [Clostridium sp.]MSC82906.1 EAL domain-containing protein [Eubacterium sp. BIOML-A1]MSD05052.1 EAL domain-containing protein [Eubacterium sp. BIOML-A2]RYT25241.1 bifunctional diguanylate cyclase/phosphodiesterase [Eubacterium sp. am_0171]